STWYYGRTDGRISGWNRFFSLRAGRLPDRAAPKNSRPAPHCVTMGPPPLNRGGPPMKVANAVAEILKREGIEFLIGYPVNPIIEAAAEADIRTIMVRQERIGLHRCDATATATSGARIGVFAMQRGPSTGNTV